VRARIPELRFDDDLFPRLSIPGHRNFTRLLHPRSPPLTAPPSRPPRRSPRFNVVSPGADEEIYFPFSARGRRLTALHAELDALVYGAPAEGASVGWLEDRSKPLLFSMARLDKVKNLTGLVAWYGASPRLRAAANLLVVGGVVDAAATSDREEAAECAAMHALIEEHGLGGQLRWVKAEKNRVRNGELVRARFLISKNKKNKKIKN
jgi:hypothetical protein